MPLSHVERRESFIGFAGVAAVTLVFFWRACLGRCFYAIDFHLTFEPLRRVLGESLRAGSVAWNPWISNGTPLLANPLSAATYPPSWLFAVLDAAPALTLLTVLHVLLGAWGVWVLARRWNLGLAGATVAA
ncbi:MAG: hypothetical protein R3344_06665, partial [Acidobacteriota bacterium]|nr:hypothetical protein [Acidobacteriota bacterium]